MFHKKRKTTTDTGLSSHQNIDTQNHQVTQTLKPKKFRSNNKRIKNPYAIVFVIAFAAIGSYLLFTSFAATSPLSKVWDTNTDWNTNSTFNNAVVSNGSVTLAPNTTTTASAASHSSVAAASTVNLAQGRPAVASSTNTGNLSGGGQGNLPASNAVDGNLTTRWGSQYSDPQWIYVDLGASYNISEVKLTWEAAYAKSYQIQVSNDATNWTTIYNTTSNTGGTNDLTGLTGSGRYVRMYGTVRGTQWGYSLWEFAVYGAGSTTPTPPTATLTASPTTVTSSQASTLTWSSTNASSCTATGAWSGTKATSGSVSTGALTQTSTFNLACTGSGGTANATVTVAVSSGSTGTGASSTNPCVGSAAPSQWKHVIVLMFENQNYNTVIGSSNAPYVTSLAAKCASETDWHDADYKVDGSKDGTYDSQPNYATLTSGVSPSVHGILVDNYGQTTSVDNIYNELNIKKATPPLTFKDYYDASGSGCGVRFSGDYHDPIRFYTDVASICDAHATSLSNFMTDLNSGNLPNFSVILPTNAENMHDNGTTPIVNGDNWAKNFLPQVLDSAQYKSGDTAIFFLWDEDTPIPNVLIAPSVKAGRIIPIPSGNPISHFSALRTWEDMLGLPEIGNTGQAPSLLPYFNGN